MCRGAFVSGVVLVFAAVGCGPPPARTTACRCHLRGLGTLASFYAEEHGGNLPMAAGESPRAHVSLQVLVDAFPDACDGDMFVCPFSDETPAVPGSDGSFQLTEKNVSYAWRARLFDLSKASADTVIACDKRLHPGEKETVNVLFANCVVKRPSRADLGEGGLDGFIARNELSK